MQNTSVGPSRKSRPAPHRVLPLLVAGLLVTSTAVTAQNRETRKVEIPDGYTLAQHILRPGDTFISITKEYLGGAALWQVNQQLNPGKVIRKLKPGERITVMIDPERVPLVARVVRHSGTVDAQATPLDWLVAKTDDLLIEKDAARTKHASSAELEFHDGTSVVITEDSLVFIRQLGRGLSTVSSNRRTQRVEIVEGQADLSSLAGSNSSREDIEVIMGSSTLKLPKESPIKTRTAIAESGASKVSLYKGTASFAGSGGTTLDLAEGEGLIAIGATAPKKEKLLPAPALTAPLESAQFIASNLPTARWAAPGDGATTYTFEVCRDPSCGELVQRSINLTSTAHNLPNLGTGTYFWRVTAASASGLDGYPSAPRSFAVVELPPDSTPPDVALSLDGFGVPYNGLKAFGPIVPLGISVSDEGTGIENSGLVINGKDRRASALLATGRTTISVFATDRAGLRSESQTLELFIDADLPDLTISLSEAPELGRRKTERPRSLRRIRKAKAKGVVFLPNAVFAVNRDEPIGYSLDNIEWRPLAALQTGLLTDSSKLQLVVNDGFCLRPASNQNSTAADGVCGRTFLTIASSDSHTGVKVLSTRLVDNELVIEATDEVGNRATLRFHVVPK